MNQQQFNELTLNEQHAFITLVQECLDGMGGSRPIDLMDDPFTWTEASTLSENGWSQHEAAGTYGSLVEKGFIIQDRDGDTLNANDAEFKSIDEFWDEHSNKVGKPEKPE